jgi:hypothetical protein
MAITKNPAEVNTVSIACSKKANEKNSWQLPLTMRQEVLSSGSSIMPILIAISRPPAALLPSFKNCQAAIKSRPPAIKSPSLKSHETGWDGSSYWLIRLVRYDRP